MPAYLSLSRVLKAPFKEAGTSVRRPRSEAGFTLIEMLVVMVIIAIIIAMVISTFRGTKKSVIAKAAQVTAFTYQDGVEAYMADNGQRVPVPGEVSWPNEDRGPVDPMFSNKPYLRVTPEHVVGGMVDFIVKGEQIKSTAQSVVEYVVDPVNKPSEYTFNVWVVEGTDGVRHMECIVTNRGDLEPNEKRCVS